jgi:rSAM/selenodomain-associated transferase 2
LATATISVIIPALNEAAHIARSVRSCAGAEEILVVDGGSADETILCAAEAGATVIMSAPGRALQQNAGAKSATGDVLLFLHADNWLGPNCLSQIREATDDQRVHGGAFRQQIENTRWAYRALEWGDAARVRWRGIAYGDQALWLRRTTFNELGGFDEVPLLEDLLLMRRLRRRAWPKLLDGPVHVSARRWERHGVLRQTLRNWSILVRHALGASPQSLAASYRRHDR